MKPLPKARILRCLSIAAFVCLATVPLARAQSDYEVQTIMAGLAHPWSIAFLPDGDLLVTQKTGELLRLTQDGSDAAFSSQEVSGVPAVHFASQGGLFDVLLAPDFATSQTVFLSYAKGGEGANTTAVARAKLDGTALLDVEEIFAATPNKNTNAHYGGRIAWLSDGTLLLTTGDGFDYREQAQNIASHLGKTLRINQDGSAPLDNPFPVTPYIWTLGHRNPQGLVVAQDGTAYLHEHGPRGGDEINRLQEGGNYGWPVATEGHDYNGARISPFESFTGMLDSVHTWVPSIAPSGFMVYEGDMFPEWQDDFFIGALVDEEVRRVTLNASGANSEEAVIPEINARIRDIRQAPDGSIYVLTDGPIGDVLRVARDAQPSGESSEVASN